MIIKTSAAAVQTAANGSEILHNIFIYSNFGATSSDGVTL